jgi:hypothetical protein
MVDKAGIGKCAGRKHSRGGFNVPQQSAPPDRKHGDQHVAAGAPGGGSAAACRRSGHAAGTERRSGGESAGGQDPLLGGPASPAGRALVRGSIAPKVSSLLSAAARRPEPAGARRPRWRKLAGASAASAAASAAAAAVRSHLKAGAPAEPDQAKAGQTAPATETGPAMQTRTGQRNTTSD